MSSVVCSDIPSSLFGTIGSSRPPYSARHSARLSKLLLQLALPQMCLVAHTSPDHSLSSYECHGKQFLVISTLHGAYSPLSSRAGKTFFRFCVKLPGAQKPEEDYQQQRFLCEDRTRKYDPKAHEKQPIHDTTLSFPRITAYKTTSISITLT